MLSIPGMLKKAASGVLASLPCSRTGSTLRAPKWLWPCWTDFFDHSRRLLISVSPWACRGYLREIFYRPIPHLRIVLSLIILYTAPWTVPSVTAESSSTITVGSKNFMESKLLAEIFAQLIEARTDLIVERRLGLAGTQVSFEALKSGAIDLYPEYTGTGLVSILQEPPIGNARKALQKVRTEFLARWNLWWLSPLGFENSYALAVTRPIASQWSLRTISDLAKVSASLKAGLGYEFIKRPDGLPGLHKEYGLTFHSVQGFQQALKYQAAGASDVDVLDIYTTDGR
ncbi:MAG: glycine betaine ABC transporter substrate-binding protein, partial [Nitrospirota bacterium]|nr:glycine betaine ABC transporter substrate-binding protein [Nitrospirota bacterium]